MEDGALSGDQHRAECATVHTVVAIVHAACTHSSCAQAYRQYYGHAQLHPHWLVASTDRTCRLLPVVFRQEVGWQHAHNVVQLAPHIPNGVASVDIR